MSCEISLVPPTHVAEIWPEAAPLLRKSLKFSHGRASLDETLRECLDGKQTLWVVFDDEYALIAAFTLAIINYPGRRVVSYRLAGGRDFHRWGDQLDKLIQEYGRQFNCTGVEITGRNGWVRVMRKYGFKQCMVTIEKDFDTHEQGRRNHQAKS